MIHGFLRAAPAALVICFAAGCGITTPDIDAEGTVRFVDVEGGCWGIETDGEMFEPIDLPAAMRIDGLDVVYAALELADRASICQIGPVIDLLRIRTPD